jgi:cation diffusion facilitator family transporter
MEIVCEECASYVLNDKLIEKNHARTQWVVAITGLMMILEITMGYLSGSMALVADGWHMSTHAGALTIALLAYKLARSRRMRKHFSFGAGKLIPLGGYTSAIILAMIALLVFVESVSRLVSPVTIQYNEAIAIACLGLCVNIVSALILHGGATHTHHHHGDDHDHDHDHDHGRKHVHDHNIRSAFLHVLADAVTSVLAIGALVAAKHFNYARLDPLIGIVGACVIVSWAAQLCRDTGWELLDGHSKTIDWKRLRALVEKDGARILDFHVWRIAPRAIACELVVGARRALGAEHYRKLLRREFATSHVIVEERAL